MTDKKKGSRRVFLLSVLQTVTDFLPGMGVEQAALAHGGIHFPETRHGNGKHQLVRVQMGTDGRVESAEESTAPSTPVLQLRGEKRCVSKFGRSENI